MTGHLRASFSMCFLHTGLLLLRAMPHSNWTTTSRHLDSCVFTYFAAWLTSGSASRCESPTTNTRFLWTTRTLARCLRFSVTFCFFSFCFCFFSFFILWMSSCDRGLYTAGSSGYGCTTQKPKRVYVIISSHYLIHSATLRGPQLTEAAEAFVPSHLHPYHRFDKHSWLGAMITFHCYHVLLVISTPFCTRDRGRSRLCGCDANRSGRSGSRRCRGRSWHRQSPAAPCTEGTPWGRPLVQGCGTSYRAASSVGSCSVSTELKGTRQRQGFKLSITRESAEMLQLSKSLHERMLHLHDSSRWLAVATVNAKPAHRIKVHIFNKTRISRKMCIVLSWENNFICKGSVLMSIF